MTNASSGGASSAVAGETAPPRFWSRGLLVLLVLAAIALTVLVLLGNWQVRRLAWKTELLATIEDRRGAPPVSLPQILERWAETGDVEYVPVNTTGRLGEREALAYATRDGQVGWHVLAPLALDDGRTLVVNRGFVPDAMRDPAARPAPMPADRIDVTGLARNPLAEKPNPFVPDNVAGEFYWKEFPAILESLGLEAEDTLPFLVDAGPTEPGAIPIGGTTIIDLPNNHLGYAATWYGIGIGLVAVVAALMWQRRRRVGAPRREG